MFTANEAQEGGKISEKRFPKKLKATCKRAKPKQQNVISMHCRSAPGRSIVYLKTFCEILSAVKLLQSVTASFVFPSKSSLLTYD